MSLKEDINTSQCLSMQILILKCFFFVLFSCDVDQKYQAVADLGGAPSLGQISLLSCSFQEQLVK